LEGTATAPWVNKVKKVVLLGGTNRGFLPYSWFWKFCAGIASLCQYLPGILRAGRLPVKGLRGSAWVTNLRMAWLGKANDVPFTIHIRGERDNIVGPHDSLDIVAHKGQELVLDGVKHSDLALLDPQSVPVVTSKLGDAIKQALALTKPSDSARPDHGPDDEPRRFVFLIHGIRDYAEWHEDLGETILQVAAAGHNKQKVEILPISYGYFQPSNSSSRWRGAGAPRRFSTAMCRATREIRVRGFRPSRTATAPMRWRERWK
jgi:hypothetical protein